MYFGPLAVADCEGCILAHSQKLPTGTIRKGQIISAEHIALLQDADITHVSVAQLAKDDLHEDAAALQIAIALGSHNTRLGAATTGRVNLHATTAGLCHFNASIVHAINSLDESITVATLPESAKVVEGQIIATVKIIPFSTPEHLVDSAVSRAGNGISIRPIVPSSAVLIQTQLPTISSKALDKTRSVTEHRLLERSCQLTGEQRVPHTKAAVIAELESACATDVDWILIFGASAISDREDVVPSAITSVGGSIERFGMPVDPGNLLLFGRIADKIVIGMPGCARSPKFNGLDKVLDRMASRAPVSDTWIASLGVGGLLSEIPDRPRPRVVAKAQPKVSALILAAGSSTRFGDSNKLLSTWNDHTLVQHVVSAAADSHVAGITVVTGFEQAAVTASINTASFTQTTNAKPLKLVHNEAFSTGMASSLVKGVSACIESDAIIVCLADMPRINSSIINQLIEAFQQHSDKAIYFPVLNGRRGNPVLVTRRLFDSMLSLTGDTGARVLAQQFPDSVCEVPVNENSIFADVDTTDALDSLLGIT